MKKLSLATIFLFSVWSSSDALSQQVSSADWRQFEVPSSQSAHLPVNTQIGFQFSPDGFQPFEYGAENIQLDLPLPNGHFVRYLLTPSQVMSPALANKYPSIRTYSGYQLDAPQNKGTFDVTPHGFHGVIEHQLKTVYIDPLEKGNRFDYVSYYRDDAEYSEHDGHKHMPKTDRLNYRVAKALESKKTKKTSANVSTRNLRTLRLAIATTGEYSQFHGGTKGKVLASLVTLVNRINQVYRTDMAVQFELVANNDEIIFLDPQTDPFDNTDDDIDLIQQEMDRVIAPDEYDVGHLVTTGGGGVATLAAVCTEYKAEGLTGSDSPINDAFYIDYVAHEIGHQLGAEHIFNGDTGGCEGNRVGGSAFEPGSGNTIMGYAGLCEQQDIALASDAHFHIHSIEQMQQTLADADNCGTLQQSNAQVPIVDAGKDYTIPAKTPFELKAYNTATNHVASTYSWYQMDLGKRTTDAEQDMTDDGKKPLFRSFMPSTRPSRSFPQYSDVLSGEVSFGETYATQNRQLNFRLVVRDNQGSVVDDHVRLNVVKVEKGFNVEQPIISNASKLHINWHTANTQHAPVACTAVDILLSTDGGLNFSQVLARKTDNDGQHTVNSSGIDTQQGRVKIACSDNVFYAINPTNLVINAPKSENATIIVPATTQPATAPPKISSPSSEVEQPTEQITVAVNTDITQSDQVTSANPQTVSSQATDSQTRGQTMDANSQGGSVYGLLILLVTVCVTRYALNLDKLKSLACSIYSNTTSKAQ